MKGSINEAGEYSGTIPQILHKGGFKVKVIVSTGELDENVKELIGNKVLGYFWDATTDEMAVHFPINLANKVRKMKQMPDLTPEHWIFLRIQV